MGLRERKAGTATNECDDRSALAAGVPDQRGGGKYAGIYEGIWMQSGTANDQARGKSLQGLVEVRRGG